MRRTHRRYRTQLRVIVHGGVSEIILVRRRVCFQKRSGVDVVERKLVFRLALVEGQLSDRFRQLLHDFVYLVVDFVRGVAGQRHPVAGVADRDEMRILLQNRKRREIGITVDGHDVFRISVRVLHQKLRGHGIEPYPFGDRIDRGDEHCAVCGGKQLIECRQKDVKLGRKNPIDPHSFSRKK